jgi:MFS family permease
VLGCAAVLTAVLAAEHALTVLLLLALGLATGIVATVDGPAVSLLGNSLVDADDVPSAIAVGSVVTSAGRILGTAIAGIAIAMLGVPAAYFLNGLTFVAVALVIPFVRLRPEHCTGLPSASRQPKGESRGGIRAGLHYLLADRRLLALLGICALTSTLGRNYGLTLAPLVTGPLHGGAKGYATISTVLAVGATLGALLSGRLQRPSVATVALLGGIGACLQMVSGLAPTMGLLFAVIVPMALVESIQDTAAGTLLQTTPPAPLRARVLGAWSTASTGWNLAGPPLLGFLLQLTGPRVGLVATGAITVAVLIGMYAQEARARWATAIAPRWLPEVS